MDRLFEQFGDAFGAFLDHPLVRAVTIAAFLYLILVWLASAFWVLQDLRRRQRDPALPFVAAAGIVIASPVLFPLAIVVYRIVRPGETLAEAREHELADRVTELEAQSRRQCPECAMAVDEAWLACPACRSRLAHACRSCNRPMELDWTVCAWCGSEFGRPVVSQPLPARRAVESDVPDELAEPAPGYRPQPEVARV
jgi:RNA polymerase subunit RPABC4/transcription elongation factor Spt4